MIAATNTLSARIWTFSHREAEPLCRFSDLTEVWKHRGVGTSIPGTSDTAATVT